MTLKRKPKILFTVVGIYRYFLVFFFTASGEDLHFYRIFIYLMQETRYIKIQYFCCQQWSFSASMVSPHLSWLFIFLLWTTTLELWTTVNWDYRMMKSVFDTIKIEFYWRFWIRRKITVIYSLSFSSARWWYLCKFLLQENLLYWTDRKKSFTYLEPYYNINNTFLIRWEEKTLKRN